MNKNLLPGKLNNAFDITAAVITKTQSCRVGRWVCSVAATLLFGVIYGVLVWGAVNYLYGSLLVFLLCLISAALAFVLFRVWLAFAVDSAGSKFAERCVMLRRGENRYYYTRNRRMSKFEYSGGLLVAYGDDYDKFFNKQNYSPLASRYSKSLQRRSSLYNTLSPSFWAELMRDMEVSESGNTVTASGNGCTVVITTDESGKVSCIEYAGKSDYLFDSLSPIKIFNGKFWGKYKITYTFKPVNMEKLCVDGIFAEAAKEFLMPKPNGKFVEFVKRVPFDEWLKQTDLLKAGQAEIGQSESEEAPNILRVNADEFGINRDGKTALKFVSSAQSDCGIGGSNGLYKNPEYRRLLPIEGMQSNEMTICPLETKDALQPKIRRERANRDIYDGCGKPYIRKTAVQDCFKLMDIYKEI